MLLDRIKNLIKEKQPDIVISTHPFSSQMVSYLKRKGKINCTLATIMTDFASHEQWLVGHEHAEFFFVSNNNMEKELSDFGVEKSKIQAVWWYGGMSSIATILVIMSMYALLQMFIPYKKNK